MRRTNLGTTPLRHFRANVALVDPDTISSLPSKYHLNGTLCTIVLTRVYSQTHGLKVRTLLVLETDKSESCMHELND